MRRAVGVACVLIWCTYQSAAADANLHLGVMAGMNLGHVSATFQEGAPYKPEPGFLAGVTAEYIPVFVQHRCHSAFRLECSYVQKIWTDRTRRTDEQARDLGWITTGTVYTDDLVMSADYVLRIPVRRTTLFVHSGPELGFNLSALEKYEKEWIGGGPAEWQNPYGWRKQPNFALNMGSGLIIPWQSSEFTIDIGYNLGLTNMVGVPWHGSVKTYGIRVAVGYGFVLLRLH
jgi:hypothetical protein